MYYPVVRRWYFCRLRSCVTAKKCYVRHFTLLPSPNKCWTGKIVPYLPCLPKTELKSSPHFHSTHLKQQNCPLQHQPGIFTLSKQVSEYIFGLPAFHSWILACHLIPSLPGLSVLIWSVNMNCRVCLYMYLLLFCWMMHDLKFFCDYYCLARPKLVFMIFPVNSSTNIHVCSNCWCYM